MLIFKETIPVWYALTQSQPPFVHVSLIIYSHPTYRLTSFILTANDCSNEGIVGREYRSRNRKEDIGYDQSSNILIINYYLETY